MKRPKICAVIVNNDIEAVRSVAPLVDLFEVRIDLIGEGWRELAKNVKKPWIATNRSASEGGNWRGSEFQRIKELLGALELKPAIVDIELATENLGEIIAQVKKKARCLLSYHNLDATPPLEKMHEIVQNQLFSGADICKVVTTAQKFEDNLSVLQLISDFPKAKVISFAMGTLGYVSRILCPLVGGEFIYASTEVGKESASGQITVRDLRKIYEVLKV